MKTVIVTMALCNAHKAKSHIRFSHPFARKIFCYQFRQGQKLLPQFRKIFRLIRTQGVRFLFKSY